MATEKQRVKNTLTEWRMDREYMERMLNDPKSSAEDKKYAKQRIKVADEWIGKILKEYPDLK